MGLEYELRLKKRLTILGVPFLDEEDLRKRGHDKTPDVLLDVPIGKGGEETKSRHRNNCYFIGLSLRTEGLDYKRQPSYRRRSSDVHYAMCMPL